MSLQSQLPAQLNLEGVAGKIVDEKPHFKRIRYGRCAEKTLSSIRRIFVLGGFLAEELDVLETVPGKAGSHALKSVKLFEEMIIHQTVWASKAASQRSIQ
jgi:hypothetical protein